MRITDDYTAVTSVRTIHLEGADPLDTPPYYRLGARFVPDMVTITSYGRPPAAAKVEGHVLKKDGTPGKMRMTRRYDLQPTRETPEYMLPPRWLANLVAADYPKEKK